jgi:hypothetical protein
MEKIKKHAAKPNKFGLLTVKFFGIVLFRFLQCTFIKTMESFD